MSQLSFLDSAPIAALSLTCHNSSLHKLIAWCCYHTLKINQQHELIQAHPTLAAWLDEAHEFPIPIAYYEAVTTVDLEALPKRLRDMRSLALAYERLHLICSKIETYLAPLGLVPDLLHHIQDHASHRMRHLHSVQEDGLKESLALWRWWAWMSSFQTSNQKTFSTLDSETQSLIYAAFDPSQLSHPTTPSPNPITAQIDRLLQSEGQTQAAAKKSLYSWALGALIQTYRLRYGEIFDTPSPSIQDLYTALASHPLLWVCLVVLPLHASFTFEPIPSLPSMRTLGKTFLSALWRIWKTVLGYIWPTAPIPPERSNSINNPSQEPVVPPGDPDLHGPHRHSAPDAGPARSLR